LRGSQPRTMRGCEQALAVAQNAITINEEEEEEEKESIKSRIQKLNSEFKTHDESRVGLDQSINIKTLSVC
jgi:hypothetical protein